MHNFAGTSPLVTMPDTDSRQLIASDLRNLIAQIEASMRLIEAVMTQDEGADQPGSADVIVLDDVTPRYVTASAALSACKAGLGLALECLSDSGKSADAAAAAPCRPHLTAWSAVRSQ